MSRLLRSLIVAGLVSAASAFASAAPQSSPAIAPTRVVHYTVPDVLPTAVKEGGCSIASIAYATRKDARRCIDATTYYDPCFETPRANYFLCVTDPRRPEPFLMKSVSHPMFEEMRRLGPTGVWFFELDDGSTCQPVAENGRNIDGVTELYSCHFTNAGLADAALGDLDSSTPVWTIREVQLNKKAEPPSIKSTSIVPVKTVWQ